MKKILLLLLFALSIGYFNQSNAQCSGAVIINNFVVLAPGDIVNYSFDWTFVQGNASITVTDSCNGVFANSSNCIPKLKDSAAGPHHVIGSFPTTCSGALTVAILIWTNNSCGGTNCTAKSLTISHTPLPVHFKSFNAARNHSSVALNWTTASEQNNSGFAIERLIGAGGWQQIAFVPSQAADGNSSVDLSYQFSDLNSTTAVSQYRLKQIDFDNRSKNSDIRAVRGEGQVGKTIVYPNPISNGRVTVVFEDVSATRDISLMDLSGRMIKQIKAVTNNNIQLENLAPGVYSLRVVNRESGEQVVEKIVVNNR